MKMVVAVIKHYKLDDVRKTLLGIGIHGMTVTEVKGFGRQKGHLEVYRGAEYEVRFLPKVKVEVAVPDKLLQKTIDAIVGSAATGEIGDGKVFVYGIEEVVRIRTNEKGEEAI